MEQQQQESSIFNDLIIDREAKQHIQTLATWAMIVAVIAIIGYLFNVIELLAPTQQELNSENFGINFKMLTGGSSGVSTVVTIVVGLIINYFLIKFSLEAKRGVNEINPAMLTSSFRNLKIYLQITSIVVIIAVAFILLGTLYVVMTTSSSF